MIADAAVRVGSRRPGRSLYAGVVLSLAASLISVGAHAGVPIVVVYDNLAMPSDTVFFSGQNGEEPRDDLHGVASGPLYRVTFDYDDPSPAPGTISATISVYGNPGGNDIGTPLVYGPHTVDGLPRGRNRVTITTTEHPMVGPNLWVGVKFSSTTAGLVLHDPPQLGSSHDLFNENGGLFNFLGNPVANFSIQVEVVDCPGVNLLYVDAAAPGADDGTTWGDAFTSLEDALIVAEACPIVNEVWVAAGTYRPSGDRSATFRLPSGASVYGGFLGGETLLSERDWKLNDTALDGDIGTPSVAGDNSYHVVTTRPGSHLDGFTIANGNAGSTAGNVGGGIDARSGGSLTLEHLVVVDNAAHDGGGMFSVAAATSLIDVEFRNNVALSGSGGAIFDSLSTTSIVNGVFTGNSATERGGAIYDANCALVITNASFSSNSAGVAGGALANTTSIGYPDIWNCVLWDNGGPSFEIDNTYGAVPSIQHSLVEGSGGSVAWDAGLGTDGGGNIDGDPLFVDAFAGDLRLDNTSPARDGGSDLAPNLPASDLDGNPRVFGSLPDMGAYELQTLPGSVIQPVGVLSTSQWGGGISDGRAANLIDGSGLSGGGPVASQTHDNSVNAATMWHAGDTDGGLGGPTGLPPAVATQALVFDLGATYDLIGALIWNHNQPGLTSRGIDEVEVLVSGDTNPLTASFTAIDTLHLNEAGGSAESAQQPGLVASGVRLVRFNVRTAHSGAGNDYVGLSEVRFLGNVVTVSVPGVPGLASASITLANAGRNPGRQLLYRITSGAAFPAQLDVFDLTGRRVFTRDLGVLGAGSHFIQVEGVALSPGLYLARLRTPGAVRSVRSIVLQ